MAVNPFRAIREREGRGGRRSAAPDAPILTGDELELAQVKSSFTDYFTQWRAGRRWGYDAERRRPIWRTIRHPNPGTWQGLRDPFVGRNLNDLQILRERRRVLPPEPAPPVDARRQQRYDRVQAGIDTARRDFAPAQFYYDRVLGRGGFGVALLFHMVDQAGSTRHIVVKADIRGGSSLVRERRALMSLAGAAHVVQRIVLAAMPDVGLPEAHMTVSARVGRFFLTLVVFLLMLIVPPVLRGIWFVLATCLWPVLVSTTSSAWSLLWNSAMGILWLFQAFVPPAPPPGLAAPEAAAPPLPPPPPPPPLQPVPPPAPAADQRAPAPDSRSAGLDPDPWVVLGALWPTTSSQRARRLLDRRRDVLVMDFCRHGSLDRWMDKMADADGRRFSDKVLWLIFECLWRGCVAMAYPETVAPAGSNPRMRQVAQRTEAVPRGREMDDPIVHFDLDPQNVLVGDFGDYHRVPIMKAADFGLARRVRSELVTGNETQEELRRWYSRRTGKAGRYFPEQFTEEWDFIPDLAALRSQSTAGNYSSHSNIFHVGMIMLELLTLNYPDEPMVARPYDFTIGSRDLRGWTYGYHVLRQYGADVQGEGSYQRTLRHLVAWCLEHDPTKRPTLTEMGTLIRERVVGEWPGESDGDTQRWAEGFFGSAPVAQGR